jgi:hypothetical protein
MGELDGKVAIVTGTSRGVGVIGAVCQAPPGILGAHHLRPLDHVRGAMW